MKPGQHFSITSSALRRWFAAQLYDALAVGVLWLIGLLILRVPLAPLWALLAGAFQFVPIIGTTFALVGPVAAAALSGGILRTSYVLILYAVIVMADGLVLQPMLMKHSARVPIWASILTPLVLGSLLSIWGVLLSVPLLVIIYAYREHYANRSPLSPTTDLRTGTLRNEGARPPAADR
jgi:predicted PurR-regulated permease PerM